MYGGVGGIAGENSGLIQNCQVSVSSGCDMTATNGWYCGGIVGANWAGAILNCSVSGTSEIRAKGTSQCNVVGGIAGINQAIIRWCYVGSGVDVNCYTTSDNSSGDDVGGIVGEIKEASAILECAFRKCYCGQSTGLAGSSA